MCFALSPIKPLNKLSNCQWNETLKHYRDVTAMTTAIFYKLGCIQFTGKYIHWSTLYSGSQQCFGILGLQRPRNLITSQKKWMIHSIIFGLSVCLSPLCLSAFSLSLSPSLSPSLSLPLAEVTYMALEWYIPYIYMYIYIYHSRWRPIIKIT